MGRDILEDRHPDNMEIAKENGYIRHQYIEDLGVKLIDCGCNWLSNKDNRYEWWMKFKELYGFDPRETWNLDTAFYEWLYEHVKAYKELACVNLEYHKFRIDNKEYTQLKAIDELLKCLRYVITHDYTDSKYFSKANKAMDIWKEIHRAMWW